MSTSSTKESIQFHYLSDITNKFSQDRIVGRGGFGTVYKGEDENGNLFAIKKLVNFGGMDDSSFVNEVQILMDLSHQNIVKLDGYCYHIERKIMSYEGANFLVDEQHKLMCFEYVSKGSLDTYISDETRGFQWHERFKIIEGICNGIHYLHEGNKENPIIHMDLKPANILLDGELVPKIADFGLSRLFAKDKTHTQDVNFVGSFGYMSPEYIDTRLISKRSDIFSLGVIIIEIIAGSRKSPTNLEFSKLYKKWKTRLEASSPESILGASCHQVKICIEIGLKCMDSDPTKRPNIVQIIRCFDNCRRTNWLVERAIGTLLDVRITERRLFRERRVSIHEYARIIQRNFRAYVVRRSEVLGCLHDLAASKRQLKRAMAISPYWDRSKITSQEKNTHDPKLPMSTLSGKIGELLNMVDAFEGDFLIPRRTFTYCSVNSWDDNTSEDGANVPRILDYKMGRREEPSPQQAARTIQTNYRSHLLCRSQMLRSFNDIAVVKAKLMEIRSMFCNISYRRQINQDSEERQRFSEKMTILLLNVHIIEGPDLTVRAAKKNMIDELNLKLLDIADCSTYFCTKVRRFILHVDEGKAEE